MSKPTGPQLTKCFVSLSENPFFSSLIICQVVRLTTGLSLIHSLIFIEIFGNTPCPMKNGKQLSSLPIGWSPSVWQLPRCQQHVCQCFPQHTPSSMAFKMTFVISWATYLIQHRLPWRKDWWTHISNWATIITRLMPLHFICGRHVSLTFNLSW